MDAPASASSASSAGNLDPRQPDCRPQLPTQKQKLCASLCPLRVALCNFYLYPVKAPNATQDAPKTFYQGIDTWRGIAALMVCIYHFTWYENVFGPLFPKDSAIRKFGEYGSLGVYLFFVISGFVIPLAMHGGGYTYRKIGRFLAKRSLRIEPPYLATIVLSIVIGYYHCRFLWGMEFVFEPKRFLAHIVYAVPFIKGMEWYNSIFWTLAIEFQFYLICAVLFPLWTHANRWVRHGGMLAFLFSARFLTDNRFVFYYAAIFGFGLLLFLLRKGFINRFEALLYTLLCAVLLYTGNTPQIFGVTVISFGLLALPDFKFAPGSFLGKMSYSLYLTHGVSGSIFLLNYHLGKGNAPMLFATALAISLVFAYLFYRLVEKPAQSLSKKIRL